MLIFEVEKTFRLKMRKPIMASKIRAVRVIKKEYKPIVNKSLIPKSVDSKLGTKKVKSI